jgi:hypothetical protein
VTHPQCKSCHRPAWHYEQCDDPPNLPLGRVEAFFYGAVYGAAFCALYCIALSILGVEP